MTPTRPVTKFLAITFGVSYLVGIPFNVFVASLVGNTGFFETYIARLATVLGPAIAAIIVSRDAVFRTLRIPVRFLHWIPVIVLIGTGIAVVAFKLAGATPSFGGVWPWFFAHLVVQIAIVGVGEELGWRGWLLPTLEQRHGFATATALTGLVWTAWHLPVFFNGLGVAISFLVMLASLSLVYAWLWQHTDGSAGIVAIAHGAVNAPLFFLESQSPMRAGAAFGYCSAFYALIAIGIAYRAYFRPGRTANSEV